MNEQWVEHVNRAGGETSRQLMEGGDPAQPESLGAQQHNHNMTLPPREAIIYAMSVRWPGELCSLNKLASVSHQSRDAAYECVQRLYHETVEVDREPTPGGLPRYRWVNRQGE
jgi:hypothetical protein